MKQEIKNFLNSKWNFIITLSLVTAIILIVTMSMSFNNAEYKIAKSNADQVSRVQRMAAQVQHIEMTRKENAAATVEPVVEVAASATAEVTDTQPVVEEVAQVVEEPVVEEYYYEEPVVDYSYVEEVSYTPDLTSAGGDYYSAADLKFNGVIYSGGWRWTWYSQNVLPGGGLSIPGRYVDENGYVCDENGRICLASEDLAYGTVVATPFGKEGCVYDCGCDYGTLDVYVAF